MSYRRIPDEVIEAVLKHHDIVDVVGKYVHLTKQGHYMKGLCPFHSEKSPSFTVTPEKQFYYCYGCQSGGNAIHFLMEMEGYHFSEAIQHMAAEANIPLHLEPSTPERTKQQEETAILLKAHELVARYYNYILLNTDQGKQGMDYLRIRGMSEQWIEYFGIGMAPPFWDSLVQFLHKREYDLPLMEQGGLITPKSSGSGYVDKFRDRIMFPIHDHRGKVIAFAGRAFGDAKPKYMNSPETPLFNKSQTLFHYNQARSAIRKLRQAVLFEGFMDVIKARMAGIENAVGTMGTALTEEHAMLLRRQADEVIVCYDGDSAGQNAAYKTIDILEKAGLQAKIAILPNGMDPDEYISAHGGETFRSEIIGMHVAATKYKLIHAKRQFNVHEPDGQMRYIDTAVKIIAALESPIEREHYVKELAAEFTNFSLETIKQQMNESRQEFLKKRQIRDKNENTWNNVMNNNTRSDQAPTLKPAYYNAERALLAFMMLDREIAEYTREQLGDQFNIEMHAALAVYIYAYYAQEQVPDFSRFLAMLQDERLESAASAILMMPMDQSAGKDIIEAYIREIKKYPQMQQLQEKKEAMIRAERSGEIRLAAQMASEIIILEQQLKSL